jgi:uncharacterized membrane protein YhhN
MPTLFIFSNLFFLILLIWSSLRGDSDLRFIIKTVACFHFVFLALWAVMTLGYESGYLWLMIGLACAFLGDVTLGLKHKGSWALKTGFLFFGLTQLSYIAFFGFRLLALEIALPFFLVLGVLTWRLKDHPAYDFKAMGTATLMYACLMILMMSCALSLMLLRLSEADLIRAIGAVCFVVSDVLLLNLYYRKQKKTGTIPVYLILYHLAQNLMALSLWFR